MVIISLNNKEAFMKKFLFFKFCVLICSITLISCFSSSSSASILKDLVIFDLNDMVHFNHLCSELEHTGFSWETYAFFDAQNNSALVLAGLSVGWIDHKTKGVELVMEQIGIKNFPSWSGDKLALALEMKETQKNRVIRGKWFDTFIDYSLGKNDDTKVRNQMSNNGTFIWSRSSSQYSSVHINSKDINPLNAVYSVNLLVRNLDRNKVLELKGPMIHGLPRLLQQIGDTYSRTLGAADIFNPNQKGGFVSWLKASRRYNDCNLVRKKAKRDFSTRFNRK